MIVPAIVIMFAIQRWHEDEVRWGLPLALFGFLMLLVLGIFAVGFMYSVMVTLAAIMLFALSEHKRDGTHWGRPLAGLCGLIIMFFAVTQMGFTAFGCEQKSNQAAAIAKATQNREAQMKRIGELLGARYAGKQALVVMHPGFDQSPIYQRGIEGLKAGVAGKFNIRGPVAIQPPAMQGPEGEDMMMMDMMMATAENIDELLEEHGVGVDVVISFIGLPHDYKDMEFWDPEDRAKMVVCEETVVGLKQLIQLGYIDAAVLRRPPKDIEELKKQQAMDATVVANEVMIYADIKNVTSVAEQHKQLFTDDDDLAKYIKKHGLPGDEAGPDDMMMPPGQP
jgi:hypothetical protein